jgi:hypothetical protein
MMISEDADLRGRQRIGLSLVVMCACLAGATGLVFDFLRGGQRDAVCAALAMLALLVGTTGAWIWSRAGQEDMRRHPEGHVARNRLNVRRP